MSDIAADPRPPRLMDQLHNALRVRHYSPRTEQAYVSWVRKFLFFHSLRHPSTMGAAEVAAYLTHLAVDRNVAAATQNQAQAAIKFLYKHVLDAQIEDTDLGVRAKKPKLQPVVLTHAEAGRILAQLQGQPHLMVALLYGSGLRLMECCTLRIKDLDFETGEITVRSGKGNKDRRTMLPDSLREPLQDHLAGVRRQHNRDLSQDAGWVAIPGALAHKYPSAGRDWSWQWVFPATRRYLEPSTGQRRRHHYHETAVQRAVHEASLKAGITKRATPRSFRHSFATELLQAGYDIRTVQELMGHDSVETTMIYLHVLNLGVGVRSPLDRP